MNVSILGTADDRVGVRVVDNEGEVHKVVVMEGDGEISTHESPDDWPASFDDLSDERKQTVHHVQRRAQYEAHWEGGLEVFDPNWDPRVIADGIEVIQSLSDDEFARLFRQTYHRLRDPAVGAEPEAIDVITQLIYLTPDRRSIEHVSDVLVLVERAPDEYEWVGQQPSRGRVADLAIELPQLNFEFEFSERFREFLIHHFRCQIRDIYFSMGEEPPEECQVDGHGKMPDYEDVKHLEDQVN
ncbi:hypothetical protein Hbl1158_14715 [Halobaculum sp. CBA1158]|uniref:hypothetical protein n=1 Tax=Halobaculum sp. CBA1158 TaxID=2904243 RepID=UPI001F271985|nr:hypothetical protein [Halobaculum sp. CBA1158]UIO99753.1 hypothetical protein Hbl1158_14715 [Halobaculum sp. CBA1158]